MHAPESRRLLLYALMWLEHLEAGPRTAIETDAVLRATRDRLAGGDGALLRDGRAPRHSELLEAELVLRRLREVAGQHRDDGAPLGSFLALVGAPPERALRALLRALASGRLAELLECYVQGDVTLDAVERRCPDAAFSDTALRCTLTAD